MTKKINWLRRTAVSAVAAVSLSLPMLSVAQAEATHAAKIHLKKHTARTWLSGTNRQKLYGSAPRWHAANGCTPPYQNQFPPCMSTWPEGSPHYHGPRPGPTFGDEQ